MTVEPTEDPKLVAGPDEADLVVAAEFRTSGPAGQQSVRRSSGTYVLCGYYAG